MLSNNTFCTFPGQGSQRVGMGKDLYERFPEVRELFQIADESLGFSLSKICFEGPDSELTLTHIAQPAILTVSVACFQLATKFRGDSFQPVAAAGHSLGEYSALVAAGALTFEQTVRLVHMRGRFMQEAAPLGSGKMVAVLGKEVSEVEEALAKVSGGVVEIANINAPGQIVVAGSKEGVDSFVSLMQGTRMMELSVSAPFHCSLMKRAEEQLRGELAKIDVLEARFPVIQNVSAEVARDATALKENLALQVCGRVRWVECVTRAVTDFSPTSVYEFGTGGVLTGLMKRINSDIMRESIGNLEQVLSNSAT